MSTEHTEDANAKALRNILENLLGTTELYALSNEDNRVYDFASAINHSKWVGEVDLSECTNITILDRLTLAPLYGIENPEPKFTIEEFVEKIINKHG